MISQNILSEAKELQLLLTKNRRHLHAHPELGFDLIQTKEYVKNELISMGYEPIECGKCGLVALVGDKNAGKTFLIRADMDALPILEQADVKFKSENTGKMHACGHDMHTAMLLEAARILKKYESEINGTIKLMFQPAEEILEGSLDMIKNMGAIDTELSFEMKLSQISSLSGDIKRGIIASGRLPLMLTRNCPIKSQVGCKNCRKILIDRKGAKFPVYCYNDYAEILNCNTLYLGDKKDEIRGVDFMTMLFYDETPDEINKAIGDFINEKNPPADFTRGLYMRGVE